MTAVESSGLDVCHKYRFACAHNASRSIHWAMKCINNPQFSTSRNVVVKGLRSDFNDALEAFWKAFKSKQVGGKDCFNKKCWASYCGTFAGFRGQWKDVKRNAANALFNALKGVPLSASRAVGCSRGPYRLPALQGKTHPAWAAPLGQASCKRPVGVGY